MYSLTVINGNQLLSDFVINGNELHKGFKYDSSENELENMQRIASQYENIQKPMSRESSISDFANVTSLSADKNHFIPPQIITYVPLPNCISTIWEKGYVEPFLLWCAWLLVGTTFYANVDFDMNYYKGFYFSVNVGYSIGFGVLHDRSDLSRAFSTCYLLIGAVTITRCVAFLIQNMLKVNYQQRISQAAIARRLQRKYANHYGSTLTNFFIFYRINFSRMHSIHLWLAMNIIGATWGVSNFKWSVIEGIYFAVSTMSTGGLVGIPADSSNLSFLFTGMFACFGVPIMASAMGDLALIILNQSSDPQEAIHDMVVITEADRSVINQSFEIGHKKSVNVLEVLLYKMVKNKLIKLSELQSALKVYSASFQADDNGEFQQSGVTHLKKVDQHMMDRDDWKNARNENIVYSPIIDNNTQHA